MAFYGQFFQFLVLSVMSSFKMSSIFIPFLFSTSNLIRTKTRAIHPAIQRTYSQPPFPLFLSSWPCQTILPSALSITSVLTSEKSTSCGWATAKFASHNLLPPGSQLCIAGCLLLLYLYLPRVGFDCLFKESEFACHRTWGTVYFWIKLKLFCCLFK